MAKRKAFLKDLITTGVFGRKKVKYAATDEKLDELVANTKTLLAQGDQVEVVVDHSKKAESVRGYLTDLYRKGSQILGVLQMLGDRGIALAEDSCQTVSLGIDDNHPLGDVIDHVSISQKPEVYPQGGFIPLGRSDGEAGLIYLSRENRDMDLKKLAEMLGIESDDLTEEVVAAEIEKLKKSETTQLSRITELEKKATEKAPPAEVLDARAELVDVRLDKLVELSRITPAVKEKLSKILTGAPEARPVVCLARGDGSESVAEAIAKVLEENDPVRLRDEKTGGQSTVDLARDDDEDVTKRVDAVVKKMSDMM